MNKKIIMWIIVVLALNVFCYGADVYDTADWKHYYIRDSDLNDSRGTTNLINNYGADPVVGLVGGAFDFISANQDGLNLSNSFGYFSGNDNFSYCMVVKPDVGSWNGVTNRYIVTYEGEEKVGLNYDSATDKIRAFITFDVAGFKPIYSSFVVSGGKTYHICHRYNATDGQSLWINGTLQDTDNTVTTIENNNENSNIGIFRDDATLGFEGLIDEFVIFNKSISKAEITAMYNKFEGGNYLNLIGDTNLSLGLNYPTNKTTYYGNYNGLVNISVSDVNGTVNCSINDSRWVFLSNDNSSYVFSNNTNIIQNNISLRVICEDLDQRNYLNFWFYLENILDIYIYDEATLQLLNRTISLDLISNSFINNYTFKKNYSVYKLPIGDYEISYTSNGYSQRQAYLTIQEGQKNNLTLYLLNSSIGTQIIATLYDEFGTETSGYYIKTYRRIFGNYYLVETSKTNTDGKTDFFAVLNTPMYYFTIEDKNGVLYKQTEETEIYGTSAEFNIQITAATGHIFDKIGNYVFSLTFDNSTNKWTYIFNDRSGTSTANKLAVYKLSDRTLIAKNETTATSGTLIIDMNGLYENGTTYLAIATANASPEFGIDSRTFTYLFTPANIEEMGLLITIILIILMAFIGFWNPAVMFVMEAFTVLLTRMAQLHNLEYSTTIIMTTLLFIIAYMVSDRT